MDQTYLRIAEALIIDAGVASTVWFFGELAPIQIVCMTVAAIYTIIRIGQAVRPKKKSDE